MEVFHSVCSHESSAFGWYAGSNGAPETQFLRSSVEFESTVYSAGWRAWLWSALAEYVEDASTSDAPTHKKKQHKIVTQCIFEFIVCRSRSSSRVVCECVRCHIQMISIFRASHVGCSVRIEYVFSHIFSMSISAATNETHFISIFVYAINTYERART